MKQGDGQKMNLTFTVQPSNWKLQALFRNSNSSGMHYLTSLIYDPPILMSHHHEKGYQVSQTTPTLLAGNGRQAAPREFLVRYKEEEKSPSHSTATSGAQGGWGISAFEGIQNWTEQGSEQLNLRSQLDPPLKLI